MATVAGIRLFEHDPDLLAPVPPNDRERAERVALVPAVRVAPGTLDPSRLGRPRFGALLLEGLLAREVTVAGTAAAELLGAGDLVGVASGPAADEIVTSDARWTVLEPLHLALLDDHFEAVIRHWPGLASCLVERAERRAARLAVAQAISHLTRVDTRVLVMLWTLAGRWGRVGSDGIALPLRLTHRTLARLVGARRPSVTTAITELCRRDLIARRDDGSWLLLGPPPEELERVGVDRILPTPAPPRRPPEQPAVELPVAATLRPLPAEADGHHVVLSSRIQATVSQIRGLADAYELQTERTRDVRSRSRAVRERSQRLREDLAAARERPSSKRRG